SFPHPSSPPDERCGHPNKAAIPTEPGSTRGLGSAPEQCLQAMAVLNRQDAMPRVQQEGARARARGSCPWSTAATHSFGSALTRGPCYCCTSLLARCQYHTIHRQDNDAAWRG